MKKLLPVSLLILLILLFPFSACLADDDSILVPVNQTPLIVQKTIAARIADGTLDGIFRSQEDGETTYDVDFTAKASVEGGFTVAADGSLVSIEVALNDVPPAVQKTIQTGAQGAQLEEIDKNLEPGDTSYDVEVIKGGVTQDFTVDDDGTLLSVAVPLDQLPDTLESAVKAGAGDAHIVSIDKNIDEPDPTYDIEVSSNGLARDFTLASDGTLVSASVALADTPGPVQKAITSQAAGAAVKSIDEDFDPDQGNTFDVVTAGPGGSARSFTLGPDGTMLSVEVTLDQIAGKARQTIQNQIGAGKILRIDQSLVEKTKGVLPYDVEARKNGQPFDFSVGPKGRFLGMDDDNNN
jgi:uncharacterized membrane protein YkoI